MADRWTARYAGRRNEGILNLKPKLSITLYGSYQPDLEEALLREIKQHLVINGYSNTSLVKDDPNTQGLDALTLSKRYLETSDVNFFIFTLSGMRQGVVREIAHVAESPNMQGRANRCTVFEEKEEDKCSIPALTEVDLTNSNIQRVPFTSLEELKGAVVTKAYFYLRKFQTELERRII